jgi:protein-disulfide isomerase
MSASTLKNPVTKSDHYLGSLNAQVVMVEYGDFECPFCASVSPIVNELIETYGSDLCFVFRQFPLTTVHPNAGLAALASEAASLQAKFWEMHHALIENHESLSAQTIFRIASELGLEMKQFRKDIDSEALEDLIQEDLSSGIRSGVMGTPTFFFNGLRHEGVPSFEAMAAIIEEIRGENRPSL